MLNQITTRSILKDQNIGYKINFKYKILCININQTTVSLDIMHVGKMIINQKKSMSILFFFNKPLADVLTQNLLL